MADDLKRSGGFIPGIRPGSETSEYLDKIMSLITLPGSVFLAAHCSFSSYSCAIKECNWVGIIFWRNVFINYGRSSN